MLQKHSQINPTLCHDEWLLGIYALWSMHRPHLKSTYCVSTFPFPFTHASIDTIAHFNLFKNILITKENQNARIISKKTIEI